MDTSRRALLGAVAASALAGCLGGSGSDGQGATTGDGTTTSTTAGTGSGTAAGGSSNATVGVDSHPELGKILVDSAGVTLYMFDSDTRGEDASTCYDSCASTWPPLTASDAPAASDDVSATLSTFEREGDGGTQVAANGWPLYYFAGDSSPGDANGQGINGVWWVLRPDGTPVRPSGGAAAGGSNGSGGPNGSGSSGEGDGDDSGGGPY